MNIMNSRKTIYTAIGTMSGTSCDGVDVAIIKTDGKDYVEFGRGCVYEYDSILQNRLKNAVLSNDLDAKSNVEYYQEILLLEKDITIAHFNAISSFLRSQSIDPSCIDLIGFHGQTIFHDSNKQVTYQIGNSQLLSVLTNCSVISDFRRRDIAFGGQGAPVTPIFHKVLKDFLFNRCDDAFVFLNIGGVSNITYIKDDMLIASDVGIGNAIIDDYIMKELMMRYDKDGMISSRGMCIDAVFHKIMQEPFFALPFPKSIDRNHFHKLFHSLCFNMKLEDILATAVEVIVHSISYAVKRFGILPKMIIVCGGGRCNLHIMRRLQELCVGISVKSIDDLYKQINGDLIEAYAFGYIAVRSLLNLPITFPSTTGVKFPSSGGVLSVMHEIVDS